MATDTLNRFVRSIRNMGQLTTKQLRRLDELIGSGKTADTDTVAALGRDDPELAMTIDFVLSATERDYDILEELGRGGQAIIFRVVNRRLGREEALKLFRPDAFGVDDESQARFCREIRYLRAVRHPHLVQVYEDFRTERGAICFTAELYHGMSLRDWIAKHGPATLDQALEWLMQISEGLEALHDQQIVHRDVKPSNIFITQPGNQVVLLDLGIAKRAAGSGAEEKYTASLTRLHESPVLGTLAYSSANQLTDPASVDPSDDVYSLGCVFYFLLTARHAFGDAATNVAAAAVAHSKRFGRPTLGPDVPPDVDDFFQQMIDPDPDKRYRHAREVAAELRALKKRWAEAVQLPDRVREFLDGEARSRRFTSEQQKALAAYLFHLREHQLLHSPLFLVKAGTQDIVREKIKEIFVPIAVRKKEGSNRAPAAPGPWASARTETPPAHCEFGKLLAQDRKLVLIGPPGSGKTMSLKRAALAFAEAQSEKVPGWQSSRGAIPIFLRLCGFARYLQNRPSVPLGAGRSSLVAYLDCYYRQEQKLSLTPDFFDQILWGQGCAVFMDGFDEVPSAQQTAVARHIATFVHCYDRPAPDYVGFAQSAPEQQRCNYFVLASSPEAVEAAEHCSNPDQDEMPATGALCRSEVPEQFALCEVAPLDFSTMRQLLANLLRMIEPNSRQREQDLKGLTDALSGSADLMDLAGSPLFCVWLGLVRKHRSTQLPRRRIDVLEEMVDLLLGCWRAQDLKHSAPRPGTGENGILDGADLETAVTVRKKRLGHIALELQLKQLPAEVDFESLAAILRKYLVEKEQAPADRADAIASQFVKLSHERSGLLAELSATPSICAFTHQRFRQYLAAYALAGSRENFLVDTVIKRIDDPAWKEVILLAGDHPGLSDGVRENLLLHCQDAAKQCWARGDFAGSNRRMTMAGLMAKEMGESLSPKVRRQVRIAVEATQQSQFEAGRQPISSASDGGFASISTLSAAAVLEQLSQKGVQALNLLTLCRTPEYLHVWAEGPELHRRFARLLLRQGHPSLALEVAARGLADGRYPNDPDLMYCRALALVRCGNINRASAFVDELLQRADLPPALRSDALSLAGRIRKDRAGRTSGESLRTERFREAYDCYKQAFELSRDAYPGINAATLALLAGDKHESRALATYVRDSVLSRLEQPENQGDSWLLAILAEAYLLLGDETAAKGRYRQAVRLAHLAHSVGDITSMLRQLRLLKAPLSIGDDLLGLFRLGPVVVFAGEALDRPGAPVCFPADPALEAAVRRAIKNELDALETNIGYCSPGCGSEVLFGELMRERDAELHVVLPFAEHDFKANRLTYGLPELETWNLRYEKLRGFLRVTRHFATTQEFLNDPLLYDFAGSFMQGLALTRAGQVDVEAVAVVVHDPSHGPAPCNLTNFISQWRQTKRELRVINLAAVRSGVRLTATPRSAPPKPALPKAAPPKAAPPKPAPLANSRRCVRSMLFADVAGFSGLPEAHLPAFFRHFLDLVKEELDLVKEKLKTTDALFSNTWGDGLYIVFSDVVTCAGFALRLLRRLEHFDFASFSFKLKDDQRPGVRIGLHTGPVFEGREADAGRNDCFGSQVSSAARIEPITAPGCAFASEQFAAALALTRGHHFVCEYLGLHPLATEYDVCPIYRLTSSGADEWAEPGNRSANGSQRN